MRHEIPQKREIEVYTGLTYLQVRMYQNLLRSHAFEGDGGKKYANMLMQLRKVCCHPYLFEGVEHDEDKYSED